MRERQATIQIRVSEREKAQIKRNAQRCNMSLSAYVRQLLCGIQPREYPRGLYSLCFEVELLMDEYRGKKDASFQKYLKDFLDDIRQALTENGGELGGDDKNMGGNG